MHPEVESNSKKESSKRTVFFGWATTCTITGLIVGVFYSLNLREINNDTLPLAFGYYILYGGVVIFVISPILWITGGVSQTRRSGFLGSAFGTIVTLLVATILYAKVAEDQKSAEVLRYGGLGTHPVSTDAINYTNNNLSLIKIAQNHGEAPAILIDSVSPYFGGRSQGVCCFNLPNEWHPGESIDVTWEVVTYSKPWEELQDLSHEEILKYRKTRTVDRKVALPHYPESDDGSMQLLFLPDDELEIWTFHGSVSHPDHPSKRGAPRRPEEEQASEAILHE
ncbi:DUF3304 domain-containing protein [uncultured Pseudacidovorax sp.]|uniref:DUF3304 domain-containing protein n=1 Tax=uncultured Pseudacidovorax sp. TaxID=679313 RepID=UPI0025D5E6BE|nr:DUF3304 domain-containing protein [uncultured Pseudacidovorax sp.]